MLQSIFLVFLQQYPYCYNLMIDSTTNYELYDITTNYELYGITTNYEL
jgi:hypothetical protein